MLTTAPLRFVVLYHSGIDAPHYDLLFESSPGSSLCAIRLSEWPPVDGGGSTRLRDHRRFYLTHEGAIPGDRGRVDRMAEGTVSVQADSNSITVTLNPPGSIYRFAQIGGGETWTISLIR